MLVGSVDQPERLDRCWPVYRQAPTRHHQVAAEHDRCQDEREYLVSAQRQQAIAHDVYAQREVVATTVHRRGERQPVNRIASRQDHAGVYARQGGYWSCVQVRACRILAWLLAWASQGGGDLGMPNVHRAEGPL